MRVVAVDFDRSTIDARRQSGSDYCASPARMCTQRNQAANRRAIANSGNPKVRAATHHESRNLAANLKKGGLADRNKTGPKRAVFFQQLADGAGFEPAKRLPVYKLSRLAP
jgi:hypothetical protein